MAGHRTPAGGAAAERPMRAAGWSAAGAVLVATAVPLHLLLPPSLALLATGCALAVAGFAAAAALCLGGRRMGRDGAAGWDLASALIFLGFAAAILADTGEALTAMAELKAR